MFEEACDIFQINFQISTNRSNWSQVPGWWPIKPKRKSVKNLQLQGCWNSGSAVARETVSTCWFSFSNFLIPLIFCTDSLFTREARILAFPVGRLYLKTLDFHEWRTADRVLHLSWCRYCSLGVKNYKSVSLVWIISQFWLIRLSIVRWV